MLDKMFHELSHLWAITAMRHVARYWRTQPDGASVYCRMSGKEMSDWDDMYLMGGEL